MTFVRDRPAQSTAARRHLPAARAARSLLLIGVLASQLAGPLHAQQTATIAREDEVFFGEIGGPRLGQLSAGVGFAVGPTQRGHTRITLEGWIFRSSLARADRDGHTLAVTRGPVENLRDGPNGKVLARVVKGFLLDEVERRGPWVKVRRTVWVQSAALRNGTRTAQRPVATPVPGPAAAPVVAAAPAPPPPQAAQTAPPPEPADPRRGVVRRRLQLYRAPDSVSVGTLEAGHPVRITARAGGWVRIETQAWVREQEVRPSDAGILTGLSAAELRGAPDEFKGKLLRWTIQYLSIQTADELRPDFAPGQKYILARGPAPEYAFVYIIVPPARLAEVQRLEPLASVQVVARVVSGRSTYLANPILELVELP